MSENSKYNAIPKYYYITDSWGVPDGKRQLSSVKCSCGKRMIEVNFESVDCGTVTDYKCPVHECGFVWWDLIENC